MTPTLPAGWSCFTWPADWRPGESMSLVQVGDDTLPAKFHLAIHTPEMTAPGGAVLFTYIAHRQWVTLLDIRGVGINIGTHLAQIMTALPPDDWDQIARQQVAAFVPARAPVPTNGAAIRSRFRLTDDHLNTVAAVYGEAQAVGAPPTRAVQHHFGVAHSTAAKWVGHARKAGLIAPTTKGATS